MKAIRYSRFGPPEVLEWVEVERPAPGANEALIKLAAAAVNPKDCLTRKGKFPRLSGTRFPLAAGNDFAGTVVALGPGSKGITPGEPVYGMLQGWTVGSYAEYVAAPVNALAPAPKNISLEDSAGIPLAAQTSLQALRDLGHITQDMRVLINGASGGVGTLAIQIAKTFGATVTAVCSARNLDLARDLGADEVVDYAVTRFSEMTGRWDIFYDVFGNQSFGKVRHLLSRRGTYITTVPTRENFLQHFLSYLRPGRKSRLILVRSNTKDLVFLATLIEQGRLRPVTDRRFRMADAAEAHRYIETRRARGKALLIP